MSRRLENAKRSDGIHVDNSSDLCLEGRCGGGGAGHFGFVKTCSLDLASFFLSSAPKLALLAS